MCGICGAIGYNDREIIVRMNQALVHRGPDDEGAYIYPSPRPSPQRGEGEVVLIPQRGEGGVVLASPGGEGVKVGMGHRRLSIIDLSQAGHQPMSNEDGRVWIVYNGEIYNFKEERLELEKKGHRFKSNTDTEVIVHLYEEYGDNCLNHLRGMFSFAIWDSKKNRLFAARDRFGIKPFFYHYKDDRFIFASELRAILASGLVEKDIDLDALANYFAFGSVQASETMLKGIFQLLPAHYLILESGQLKIEKYWEIGPVPQCRAERSGASSKGTSAPVPQEKEYVAEIRYILDEAVKIRLISDVPIGAFLSGGIDSSAIVSLMQRHSSMPIKTFSVVFKEEKYDEREFSNKIAKMFGTDHRQILLEEKDILKEMPAIFDAMDQPSADGFNSFIISKAVKEAGLTVALSGLGGDELFAGYRSFKTLPRIARILNCARHIPGKQQLFFILSRLVKSRHGLKAAASLLKCEDICDLYRLQRMVFLPQEVKEIASSRPDVTTLSGLAMTGERPLRPPRNDDVNLLSYLELTNYLQNTLLQDTDRMSMANSLEVRVPFLDHLLVEKMFEISGRMKVGRDYPKRLLVKAMMDLLPKEVYNRPKMGFVLPFDKWLRGDLRDYCDSKFTAVKNIPILNTNAIDKMWNDFLKGSKLYNYCSILTIISFINWYEKNMRS